MAGFWFSSYPFVIARCVAYYLVFTTHKGILSYTGLGNDIQTNNYEFQTFFMLSYLGYQRLTESDAAA